MHKPMSALPPKVDMFNPLRTRSKGLTGSALSSPRWQITIDLLAIADEDNAVLSRIATVPFNLDIGNGKPLSVLDVRATEWQPY